MKKLKTLLITLVGLLSVSATATGFTYAWLSNATTVIDFDNAGGGTISSYFHCGTGDEEDDPETTVVEGPYVITRPVHLYNLVELMYADVETFQVYDKCFQLGYDLDGDPATLEFYNYDDNGVLGQGYSQVLNMGFYKGAHALLPIGQYHATANYPFAGKFDGSGLTITNLEIKGGKGIDDIGFFGYVTSDASIHDLYIDNITLNVSSAVTGIHAGTEVSNAHADNAHVGYIAGHIENANCFQNVYVNSSTITGTGAVAIKNNWGFYGRCDNAKTIEDFIGRAGIEDPSWGGSVNMSKMYTRLYDIAGSATQNNNYVYEKEVVTRANGTTFDRTRTTGRAFTYRNRQEGSFVFSAYDGGGRRGNYLYVSGGKKAYPYKQTETTSNDGFTIRSGTGTNARYLGIQNGAIANIQTGWFIDSSDRLAAYVNDTLYFLNHNCQLVSDTTDTWIKTNNTIYYSERTWLWNTNYYLTYRNNRWQAYDGNATLTLTATTVTKITESSNGTTYMDYSGTEVTYFPLITEDNNNNVAAKNTGYVIGGAQDKTTSVTYPNQTGDIRVSKYSTSDISNSYSNRTLNHVYTINSSLQTVEITSTMASTFEKYSDSKDAFLDMISGGNIYGLHFMSADISIDNLVTADYTLINGVESENYKMPASSIDFNLATKGCINFFAGTYFSNNNSFFSLHHIERDEDKEITAIKEITEVYKSANDKKSYIYRYSDNTTSGTITSDYSLVFSTSQIKVRANNSGWKNDAVYYFEIPVNAGEYALGSVNGGTGAYLMYLDIASNGGIDFNADVNTFGSIDYRSAPDVVEISMLLITYEQAAGESCTLTVVYTKSTNRYDVTYTGTLQEIIITVLNEDTIVYFNGSALPQQRKANRINLAGS